MSVAGTSARRRAAEAEGEEHQTAAPCGRGQQVGHIGDGRQGDRRAGTRVPVGRERAGGHDGAGERDRRLSLDQRDGHHQAREGQHDPESEPVLRHLGQHAVVEERRRALTRAEGGLHGEGDHARGRADQRGAPHDLPQLGALGTASMDEDEEGDAPRGEEHPGVGQAAPDRAGHLPHSVVLRCGRGSQRALVDGVGPHAEHGCPPHGVAVRGHDPVADDVGPVGQIRRQVDLDRGAVDAGRPLLDLAALRNRAPGHRRGPPRRIR